MLDRPKKNYNVIIDVQTILPNHTLPHTLKNYDQEHRDEKDCPLWATCLETTAKQTTQLSKERPWAKVKKLAPM